MTSFHRISNLVGVILPPAGVALAIVLLWNTIVGWHDVAIMLAMYLLTGVGITVGFHRYLTHRSFATSRPVESAFAVLGSMAVEGSVICWVADHRKHHAHTDRDGDPHSPHVDAEAGVFGAFRGLFHAHVGWIFSEHGRAAPAKYAPDLWEDRRMRFIDRTFLLWVLVGFAIPFGLGWAIAGTLAGALTALLWGGLVRVFLLHHVTWSINSVCHFFGRRRFATDDESRNVFWLAPLSFGESWHHNHHAFPRSAFHGLRPSEVDPGGLVIRLLERLGLVWNVVRISPERQAQKVAGAEPATPSAA